MLLLTSSACSRSSAPFAAPPPGASGGGSAGSTAGRRSPSTDCQGGSLCSAVGATCRSGEQLCACAHACYGADMPGAHQGPFWSCMQRPRGCPDQVPTEGERCRKDGLQCAYGTCGGATATCEGRVWTVLEYDPPA